MKEIPLLFSAPMVRATIEGRKDVTRRIAKVHPFDFRSPPHPGESDAYGMMRRDADSDWEPLVCPYGGRGDVIWGREAWRVARQHDGTKPSELPYERGLTTFYEAGGSRARAEVGGPYVNDYIYPASGMPDWVGKLRPSIHMPRAFTRIVRPIISVRLEHLHAITPADARREGVTTMLRSEQPFIDAFRELWDGLNAARGAGWNTNPLVWRIEYERRAEA